MAVIQDLPPEILHRILELGAEEDSEGFQGRGLCSTALVARAWLQPSQELLAHELWSPDISNAPQYDTSPPPTRLLRSVTVDSSKATDRARSLVERHGTQLHELHLNAVVPASELSSILTSGVRRLALYGRVTCHSTFPDRTQLQLDSLYLSPLSSSSDGISFIQQLVDKSPHLTRLKLYGVSPVPPTFLTTLLPLGPQLRHITIFAPSCTPHAGRLDSCALLRACTSLVSLDIPELSPGHLSALLSSIPSELAILTCSFDIIASTDESVCSDLLGALEQPALANLKRWRWVDRRRSSTGYGFAPYAKGTVDSWEAACRARGIEPRGDERYFTD